MVGELCRRLGLVAGLERALDGVTRARPFKQRRRGASAGELLVSLAESMLVGGDTFNDLEDLRADDAGAELRAVADVPAPSTQRTPPPSPHRTSARSTATESRHGPPGTPAKATAPARISILVLVNRAS